jgi:putrescine transport system substrate-binding protein
MAFLATVLCQNPPCGGRPVLYGKSGTVLTIPKDAAHVANAYLLINYLIDPQVAAHISNAIGFANANMAATPLLDASIKSNAAIIQRAKSSSGCSRKLRSPANNRAP